MSFSFSCQVRKDMPCGIAFGTGGALFVSYENSLSESSEGILDAIPARSGAMLPLRRRTPICLSRESVPGSTLDPPPP